MKRRVVITGMGAVTPLGHSVTELYQNQLEGKSGVAPITLFEAARFPTKFAAEVKNFRLERWVKDSQRWTDSGANSRFAAAAAQQALQDAGILDNEKIDRTRCGVYLGSGEGIQDFNNMVYLIAQSYRPETNTVDTPTFTAGGLARFHSGARIRTRAAHDARTSGGLLRPGRT